MRIESLLNPELPPDNNNKFVPHPNVLIIDKDELPKSIPRDIYTIYIVADSEELIKKRLVPVLRVRQKHITTFIPQIYRINSLEAIKTTPSLPKNVRTLTKKEQDVVDLLELLAEEKRTEEAYSRITGDYESKQVFYVESDFDEEIIENFGSKPKIIFHLDKFSEAAWNYIVQHRNIKGLIIDCQNPPHKKYIPGHIEGVFLVGNNHKIKSIRNSFECATKKTETFPILSFSETHTKFYLFMAGLRKKYAAIADTIVKASELNLNEHSEGDNNNNNNNSVPTNAGQKLTEHGLTKKRKKYSSEEESDNDEDFTPEKKGLQKPAT